MIGKVRALGEAVPSRHLQMYYRDDRLQQLVEEKDLGGVVPNPTNGNLTGVYTQNGNGSKMDVFQRRTVKEFIQLRKDGSAKVTRTVRLKNASPPFVGPGVDIRRGYATRWATNLVINLMPKGARVLRQPEVVLTSTVGTGKDQDGRTFAKAAVAIPPRDTVELTWTYVVPKALKRVGAGWRFVNHVQPQPMLEVPTYKLTLSAPRGWRVEGGDLWKIDGEKATSTLPMNRSYTMRLLLTPS